MSTEREMNLALFIDFDNIALGARDARQRFDVKLLVQRVLEKGKIIVKRAYADWHYYKEHMIALHEAAIELIEVPMPRISGKNSADIKMVVDAMDLCYSKHHIDAFVLVTGDSDFSPLVSKLRENDKRVIGIGMKNSSSKLLIGNCDEFIFYDDIYNQVRGVATAPVAGISGEKGKLFGFLIQTVQSLLQESHGILYGSLIKDTMTRKRPDFNERAYGYSTFGDLLEEGRKLGLLEVERDARAGGTWVVQGLGARASAPGGAEAGTSSGTSRSSRRRRRSSDRNGRRGRGEQAAADAKDQDASSGQEKPTGGDTAPVEAAPAEKPESKAAAAAGPEAATGRKAATQKTTASKTTASKTTAKKTTTKKVGTKKTAKKTTAKKTTTKKTTTKKTASKKTTTKKTVTKKTATKKTVTKKAVGKKKVSKKASGKNAATSESGD